MCVITPTAVAIGTLALAAISTGISVYTATKGTPTMPTPKAPVLNPPATAPKPAPFAPIADIDSAEGKSRAAAARMQRDLESRRSGASTILTSPLGVSTPSGNVQSTVLGR